MTRNVLIAPSILSADFARLCMYAYILSARFVRIWNVCCGASAITAKTLSMNASGTSSWNRSLMLFTKMRAGFFQESGAANISGTKRASPVHTGPRFVNLVRPSYGWPAPEKRCAWRSA